MTYRIVKSKNGVEQIEPALTNKYVLTDDLKLAIGSAPSDDKLPSHASIAELTDSHPGASDRVIMAGYIFRRDGQVYVDNYSGHYQPPHYRLDLIAKHLKSLEIEAVTIRTDTNLDY